MEAQIQTNPLTTIRPPSYLTNHRWQVELLNQGKKWKVDEIAIACLKCAAAPVSRQVLDQIASATLVDQLLALDLILYNVESRKTKHPSLNPELWARYQAEAAGDYHRATFDHPFMDYSPGGEGWSMARERMAKYSQKTKDIDRFKEHYQYLKEIPLAKPAEVIPFQVEGEFFQRLKSIIAMTFMPIGTKPIPWSDVPLIRRTSPSGGSRHPIEAYMLLDDGRLFHCSTKKNCLGLIGTLEDVPVIPANGARFFLTCVFERNSFRYREPRTFRSIHMDAGHIASTLDFCATAVGLQLQDSNGVDETWVNGILGINGYEEFLMATLDISDGKSI